MTTSWADSVADSHSRVTYVPPHLRNKGPILNPPPAVGHGGGGPGPRWAGAPRPDFGRPVYSGSGGGGRTGGGWNNSGRGGGSGWDYRRGEREANPFGDDDVSEVPADPTASAENTGINFDAYDDIPVETSRNDVPPAANTFAEIEVSLSLSFSPLLGSYLVR